MIPAAEMESQQVEHRMHHCRMPNFASVRERTISICERSIGIAKQPRAPRPKRQK
jgi:hypothetical protein